MNLYQISKKLNVSYPAVWKWFTGKNTPTLTNLKALALEMGCTTDDVIECMNRYKALADAGKPIPYAVHANKKMLIREYDAMQSAVENNPI